MNKNIIKKNISNKYFIKAILLKNCLPSKSTYELLKKYNIPHKIIVVDDSNKDIYKTDLINTYPQIYLNKINHNGNLLLGGYTDFKNCINNFKNTNIDNAKINEFIKKYRWSKKITLRLIQLINTIN